MITATRSALALCLIAPSTAAGSSQSTNPDNPGPPPAQDRSKVHRMPMIGEKAPAFTPETTLGPIHFTEQYKGHWVILSSHPGDFTPVCTTEFMTFTKAQQQFKDLNCYLVGHSVDSKFSHIAWLLRIEEKARHKDMEKMVIRFPVIVDPDRRLAGLYGMIHPEGGGNSTIRAVFVIDPEAMVRAILYYPHTT